MNFFHHNKNSLAGIALVCAAIGCSALTLGRLRGAALLGQPLDVVIAVQAGPDEDVAGLCFDAEVFYADSRVDPSRVRVKFEPAVQAQGPAIRVSSSVKIDEPVVTVNLRAGCNQKTSRRYVVLAELASDVADLPPATAMPVPPSLPMSGLTPAPGAVPRALAAPGVATPPTAVRSRRQERRAQVAAAAVAESPNAGPARQPAARKQTGDVGNPGRGATRTTQSQTQSPSQRQNQPRALRPDPSVKTAKAHLKLDPADLVVTDDLGLRLSQQLNLASIGNEKLRAEAIALWRAINANPVDILRDSQRVATLEGNIATLRALTDKSQGTLADLTLRLQKAESERSVNKLVYLLAALAALALVAATYFWSRQRGKFAGGGDWWHSSNPAHDSINLKPVTREGEPAHASVPRPAVAPAPRVAGPARSSYVDLEGLDLDLSVAAPLDSTRQAITDAKARPTAAPRPVAATRPAAMASLPAAPPDSRGFAQSMGGALRAINTEELLDIRQQAEFFVSVGQHDQAIQILEARIREYGDSSPLVYLDLLKIFHALNRRSEFRQYQQDFNRRFNGRANDFYKFADEGQGLIDYPAALTQLAALWPSEQALEFMEDCIFRTAEGDAGQSFDLAAFRDLLLLHVIARDLDADNSGPAASGYARLSRGPKVNADTGVSAVASALRADANRRHTGLALDIDLDSPALPLPGAHAV